ncbi:MAG: sulfatase-like hydrolase/transferase, partial [Chloroflexi bacterium]|nr:sulfatase-like hydrolase/transferase [Chloroflexota bacterium]
MSRMTIRLRVLLSLVLLGLVLLLTSSWSPASATSDSRPNIIFILADDMGWSDLGSFGSEIETPNLDALAYNGIRATNFYNTAKCFPTRAIVLTGTYAQQNGLATTNNAYLENAATLGEILREAGYLTLMSGKHHGLDNPFDRGFDRSYGLLDGATNYFNPGLQRSGEDPPKQKNSKPSRTWMDDGLQFDSHDAAYQDYFAHPPGDDDYYITDDFTNRVLEYLDTYQDDGQPFFLYLPYTAPHDPLHAPEEIVDKYEALGLYDQGYDVIRDARYANLTSPDDIGITLL